jgi:hypothetical protein
MITKVSFNIEPDRYNEFSSLLGQFAETLSGDSIIEHSNAYIIEEALMIVVATSNSFDGMRLYGPFEDEESAQDWASENAEEWHTVEVTSPADLEEER